MLVEPLCAQLVSLLRLPPELEVQPDAANPHGVLMVEALGVAGIGAPLVRLKLSSSDRR